MAKKPKSTHSTAKEKYSQAFSKMFLAGNIDKLVELGRAYKNEYRKGGAHWAGGIQPFEPWDFIFSCIPLKTVQNNPGFIGEALLALEEKVFSDDRVLPVQLALAVMVDSLEEDGQLAPVSLTETTSTHYQKTGSGSV